MKKSWFVVFLNFILLFGVMGSVSAGKPQPDNPNLQISSVKSYYSILLNYKLANSKKTPDQYTVKKDGIVLYDGPSTNYEDTSLQPGTDYTYTIEAYFRGKLLAATTHDASTLRIVIAPIEVKADVEKDKSVVVRWLDSRTDLVPDEYRVYVNGILHPLDSAAQQITLSDLQPGQYTVLVEGLHQGTLVSEGSQSFTIEKSITVSPIELQTTLNTDFSADVYYEVINPELTPNHFKVYVNGTLFFAGMPDPGKITIPGLEPGETCTVKFEAYHENHLVAEGSTSFIAPYSIGSEYDYDWETRLAIVTLTYDQQLQNADRMVILRKEEFYVNGFPQETKEFVTVYDGTPINSITEGFIPEVTRHNYTVLNYRNGILVGIGRASVPNVFDY